jgi:hypothetical protein
VTSYITYEANRARIDELARTAELRRAARSATDSSDVPARTRSSRRFARRRRLRLA